MKELEKEIAEAIEKNLPAQVGKSLQERLKKVELLEDENESLRNRIKEVDLEVVKLNGVISKYSEQDQRNSTLEVREKVVEEKERRLEIELLTLKVSEAEKRADMVSGFMSGLVRNSEFRREVVNSKSGSVPISDGRGGYTTTYTNNTVAYTEETKEI